MPPDDSEQELLNRLYGRHADELVYLTDRLSSIEKHIQSSWFIRSLDMIKAYFVYVATMMAKAVWEFFFYPTSEHPSSFTSC